jgi:hypothetical protein
MLGSPEKFYEDVAGALKQQYGKLVGGDDEEEGDEGQDAEPGDSSRVAGLGSDGTPAKSKKPGVGQEKGADMFDDLRAIQKRMGLI